MTEKGQKGIQVSALTIDKGSQLRPLSNHTSPDSRPLGTCPASLWYREIAVSLLGGSRGADGLSFRRGAARFRDVFLTPTRFCRHCTACGLGSRGRQTRLAVNLEEQVIKESDLRPGKLIAGMDSSNDTLIPDLTTMEIETQSDDSESSGSGSSVFKTQCDPSSLKEKLEKPLRTFVCSPERVQITDSSSGSDWEPRPLTLKAVFEQFKQKKRKKKKKKYKPYGRSQGRRKARTPRRTSQIDKKQFRAKGPGFSFLETENVRNPIPWKKILTFEQAVARGFFKYLEKLKYEHHLKESLKLMNVGEDLEKDDLDSRIYKYLDDDGSLSPIEDTV
ncbi:TATA box-binding protein-associated factor RNA polymerase I subunit D [Rhynchocyon petersi]